MIQLPSKIRTTLFNASVEKDPYQLFSHEPDRVAAVIHVGYFSSPFPAFGRSSQDVLNSNAPSYMFSHPIIIYGPEPIWMGNPTVNTNFNVGTALVQGIYRA